MATNSSTRPPIVFIHGLWLHADSWNYWLECFRQNGYEAAAVRWPGESDTVEATRKNADAVAGYGVTEIADDIAAQMKSLRAKPIVIGHSFGGLFAQNLLGRDLAVAGIAIDPAPIKGVPELPLPALRANLHVIANPFNFKRAVSLTEAQFRYAFANAVPERESLELFAKYTMPSPARPLFQAASASLNPNAATKVNVSNGTRGPLLLISGTADHAVPNVLVKSALRTYRNSGAVTEYKEFAGRGHSLTIDSGWRDVADYCLGWLKSRGM